MNLRHVLWVLTNVYHKTAIRKVLNYSTHAVWSLSSKQEIYPLPSSKTFIRAGNLSSSHSASPTVEKCTAVLLNTNAGDAIRRPLRSFPLYTQTQVSGAIANLHSVSSEHLLPLRNGLQSLYDSPCIQWEHSNTFS